MSTPLYPLTEAEHLLVRATAPPEIAGLDEDALLELHTRVRRARNKYAKLYRRTASTRVAEKGGRGKARPANLRNLAKAEVFEQALARVSRRLAAEARRNANELKAQRLQAARDQKNMAPPRVRAVPRLNAGPSQRPRPVPAATPARRKQHAATGAAGVRRQAKRDSRP